MTLNKCFRGTLRIENTQDGTLLIFSSIIYPQTSTETNVYCFLRKLGKDVASLAVGGRLSKARIRRHNLKRKPLWQSVLIHLLSTELINKLLGQENVFSDDEMEWLSVKFHVLPALTRRYMTGRLDRHNGQFVVGRHCEQ